MKITKGHWLVDGEDNSVSMKMEFSKVDKENRLVSGFATLDNVDTQDDIVEADAAMKAFARARGNIREQHDKFKAVGKMVKFKLGEFYDKDEDRLYKGVYITVRVSKGAQDTWEKVLDGTLSGFSIGGSINEATNDLDKAAGKKVRRITDFEVTEVSLVDNPANQKCNILSIKKSADGSVKYEGQAADVKVETVYYCPEDGNVQPSPDESVACFNCGGDMQDIGWFEVVGDKLQKVREIVSDFIKSNETDEGGVTEMGTKDKETFTKAADTEEEIAPVQEVTPVETAETPEPELVAEVVEVEDAEKVIAKQIDDLKDAIHNTLESSKEETQEIVKSLEAKIDELNKSFEQKTSEIDTKLDDFSNRLDVAKSQLAQFEKSLDIINSSTAIRKSSDVVSEQTTEKKSKWDGAFSVDNLVR